MSGTGISVALEVAYAGNRVPHGKTVSRALRGHQLLDLGLNNILLEDLLPELDIFKNLMPDAKNGRLNINNAIKCDILKYVENVLSEKNKKTKNNLPNYRTTALWLHIINIVCKFIRAERLGDWHFYLSTLREMLPNFAVYGHSNYTKSIWLHLYQISTLETDYSYLFKQFIAENHILSRTNFKCCRGISIYQGIEQALMRDLKSKDGLTKGRGFDSLTI